MGTKKYYVIWLGHQTGIVDSWEECRKRIFGYKGARYKSYKSLDQAKRAFIRPWNEEIGNPSTHQNKQKSSTSSKQKKTNKASGGPLKDSLAVDAACSGNPGAMEYRGVYVKTNEEWFHAAFNLGTNNIGEFLAIVHGLAELKRCNLNIPIYTDSTIALGWIKKKKCATKLERIPETEKLFQMIERAEKWLRNNTWSQPVLKWDTDTWGEIPADFGRK
ncbi:MAG: ribonuclease H family protein [Marinilabilia sp.]